MNKKAIIIITTLFSIHLTSMAQSKIDFSQAQSWICQNQVSKSVDVFYIYPTVLFSQDSENMNLSDEQLKKEADGVLKEQTGVFKSECNIFAPYYPQMSIGVLSLNGEEYDHYFNIAYQEVKTSFLYYLKNFNKGKPFFLAGHSQGSLMLLQLLKDLFNDDQLREQLIAAYLIGYSVTDEDLHKYPWLQIAQGANDLGVIITYNTQSPKATGSPVLLPNAHCVNPLNWKTTYDHANKEMNLGAVFFNENEEIEKEIPEYTDAQIREDGALIVKGPNPDHFYVQGKSFFPKGVFHKYDYQFFYRNLEENIKVRKDTYLKAKE
jgi:hypothetical protein